MCLLFPVTPKFSGVKLEPRAPEIWVHFSRNCSCHPTDNITALKWQRGMCGVISELLHAFVDVCDASSMNVIFISRCLHSFVFIVSRPFFVCQSLCTFVVVKFSQLRRMFYHLVVVVAVVVVDCPF